MSWIGPESGWYLVYFHPKYYIYPDLFHLGQQFNLRRHLGPNRDHERDAFTVYHENGDIGKCMARCQGEWLRITTKQEYDFAVMVYPSIIFEVDYESLI